MIKKLFLGVMALGLIATSCSSDDDNGPTTQNLTLNLSGLEDLGSDYVYEGWIIVSGAPVSTGTFTVDGSGTLSQTTFAIDATQLSTATAFVLSVEPAIDTDPAPAATKLLQGDFSGDSATVNTGIVGDFSNAAGDFFLRSPTDEMGTNNGNDENGIWFGTPGMPPTPNFVLPTLPAGWAYEGWVVGDTGPLTTGTFTAFNAVDDAAPFSATMQAGPPIPGEDFFMNAPTGETFPLDIRNRTVVISVEPVPDNSPAPFVLKPLVGTAGTETAPSTHPFGLNLGSLPTGSVTR
ncbi:MAG: anti-sigma factor [Bacteroidia bacterium]|nr:anti-sigma factor [Bacteroidia bacterium]NND12135.1 anti-sigma factor [Flavobacteriaceae bacterium]MBT8310214.1 anti-sigma factor [Bacteroidia bacterium]NNK28769.1 anti-sigma factor [Flavobacteriaceae bacterium]NNL60685.1 anti-sigma factor [Flavobacteriaceae bacterium]